MDGRSATALATFEAELRRDDPGLERALRLMAFGWRRRLWRAVCVLHAESVLALAAVSAVVLVLALETSSTALIVIFAVLWSATCAAVLVVLVRRTRDQERASAPAPTAVDEPRRGETDRSR